MYEWQPIETAPKTDEHRLLWVEDADDAGIYTGYWYEIDGGEWVVCAWDSLNKLHGLATPLYWMPLPAPPASGT